MADVRFDRFYGYEDLTRILEDWAKEHPRLLSFDSIGQSNEGRDIWLCTITDAETGPAEEKPALWLEANIHATELTGSAAALHLIHRLLSEHASNPQIRRALETRTFYVVPRLNPDGAENALADPPKFIRSSTRAYPLPEAEDGLHKEDIDGDGRILMMRVPDPCGAWKPHPTQPRLMVRRDPDEEEPGATYYRLLPEGTIRNYDGVLVKVAPPLEGLDLNRNFPADWQPEGVQKGAGPYPASEPEIRAEVHAIDERPNVCIFQSYHTAAGAHLRSYASQPDDKLPTADLRIFKWMGEEATRRTGLPSLSIYHDFAYDPKQPITGGSIDWLYDTLGIFAWVTEFWSPVRRCGIEAHPLEWFRDHPIEDEVKLLEWNDRVLDGKGYVDWYPFDHPQLGRVELGGWDHFNLWTNPPAELLEDEIAPHADLVIFNALITPQLAVRTLTAQQLGAGRYLVRLVIENRGWLPTNVSERALERKAVRPLETEIELPEGCSLVTGTQKVELGQLTGRAEKRSTIAILRPDDSTTDLAKAEWIVEAPAGETIRVTARHPRAGTVRREVVLQPE